jgi:hypothetical protein
MHPSFHIFSKKLTSGKLSKLIAGKVCRFFLLISQNSIGNNRSFESAFLLNRLENIWSFKELHFVEFPKEYKPESCSSLKHVNCFSDGFSDELSNS